MAEDSTVRLDDVERRGRQIEERYRAIFDHSFDAVFLHDFQGQFLDANRAALNLLGYSPGDIAKLSVSAVLADPADVKRSVETVRKLLAGAKQEAPEKYLVKRSDGREVWVEVSASLVFEDGKPIAVQGIARDITAQKRAEAERQCAVEELRQNNERLQAQHAALTELTRSQILANEHLEDALRKITERVAETLQVERVSVWRCNPQCTVLDCLELYERSPRRHSAGLRLSEADSPNYFRALAESRVLAIPDALEDDRTRNFAEGYLRPSGIVSMLDTPVYLESELTGVVCLEQVGARREWRADEQSFAVSIAGLVSLAIAQWRRWQAEAKLQEQASLLDQAHDAIFVTDLDQAVTYWNKAAESNYGWPAAEVLGRNITELVVADAAVFAGAIAAVFERGQWSGELEHFCKDKRKVRVDSRWALMRDAQGKPRSILFICTDITEKKKLEAQFLRAQRLESIGTLAGGIAHDLNNVLAPIMMAAEVLQEEVQSPGGRELLATLQAGAERGAALVKQVLAFARGVESRKFQLDPAHILRELRDTLKNTLPKSIQIELIAPKGTWTVVGDTTQLHQVFMNLAVNARDAMPDGGTLRMRLENAEIDEVYCGMNPNAEPGKYVLVSIADTGTGIPPEARDLIFDPFFTTKQVGKGTGLGLSTSLALVKSHGGFIDFSTEIGKGTTFKVYLPADVGQTASGAGAAGKSSLPEGRNELLLVVDDEEPLRRVARKALERHGYRVELAANGVEAVSIYAQRQHEIALVLTDMAMPIMDGAALIGALKAMNPNVRIIAFSGHASEGSIVSAVSAGIERFVPKPYTIETLTRVLAEALGRSPNQSGVLPPGKLLP